MSQIEHNDKWFELLSAFIDGECTRAESEQAEAHLPECAACREWIAQAQDDAARFTDALMGASAGLQVADQVARRLPAKQQEMVRPRFRLTLVEVLVVIAVLAVFAAIIFPVFSKAREKARPASCLSNIKQIGLGMLQFAADHEDQLPSWATWESDIDPYVRNDAIFICPSAESDDAPSYAMNPRLSGVKIDDVEKPAETILLYEVDKSGKPDPRHNDGMNCGFVDGHAKWLKDVPTGLDDVTTMAPPTSGYGLAPELKIAYDATTEIWVDAIHTGTVAAERVASECGGFLLLSSLEAEEAPYRAEVVMRVPTDRAGEAVNELAHLGWVARSEIRGVDMTAQFVAQQQRKAERTKTREDVLSRVAPESDALPQVARELKDMEDEVVREATEVFSLASETTLATISATLTQRSAEPPPLGIAATWASAKSAVLSAVGLLLRVAIWLLVFAWIWAPALWFTLRWRRTRAT